MLKIANKMESYELIIELGLNKLPEIMLKEFDEDKVKEFIKKYPSPYYAVRDKAKSGSKLFNLKVEKDKVVDYVRGQKMFTINVSTFGMNNQLLTGEIQVSRKGDIVLTASRNPNFSARDGALFPDYTINSNIFDKKLKRINGLDSLIDYIFKHELFDVIVEFACFNSPMGTNNELVVVFELRTDY